MQGRGARLQSQLCTTHPFIIQNSASSHDRHDTRLHRTQHWTCALVSYAGRHQFMHSGSHRPPLTHSFHKCVQGSSSVPSERGTGLRLKECAFPWHLRQPCSAPALELLTHGKVRLGSRFMSRIHRGSDHRSSFGPHSSPAHFGGGHAQTHSRPLRSPVLPKALCGRPHSSAAEAGVRRGSSLPRLLVCKVIEPESGSKVPTPMPPTPAPAELMLHLILDVSRVLLSFEGLY